MKCVLSLRLVLALIGLASVGLVGGITWYITWNAAMISIGPVAADLEHGILRNFVSILSGVEASMESLSMRGGLWLEESSQLGCCSAASEKAKYLGNFTEVRQILWESLVLNDMVEMSFVGTISGSLLQLERTKDMTDIDGTQALGGRGNLRWILSDASTNYTFQSYMSNSFHDEIFFKSVSTSCTSTGESTSYRTNAAALVSKSDCESAAAALHFPQNLTEISDSGDIVGCFISNGSVYWNPVGESKKFDAAKTALCSQDTWFKRDRVFVPNCSHPWPCTQGTYVSILNPRFHVSRSSTSSQLYNATKRDWYVDAIEHSKLNGSFCQAHSDCRFRPTWGGVFFSVSNRILQVPVVFPVFEGSSDSVRAVLGLAHSSTYLDATVDQLIRHFCLGAKAWIVDMRNSNYGGLIASSPIGLATSVESTSVGVGGAVKFTQATSAAGVGPGGDFIQDVSIELVNRYGAWENIPDDMGLVYKDNLIEVLRLSDEYLLDWMIVLSIPTSFVYKDLPKSRDISIGIICGIAILMACVFFLISHMVTRSLATLGLRMSEVAALKLDREEDKLVSIYSEVIDMETSFETMAGELKVLWTAEHLRVKKLEGERDKRRFERMVESVKASKTLRHPMVLCSAGRFVDLGALVSYEMLRDRGHVIVLDTMTKVDAFVKSNFIVFISHQWLGWGTPDPDNIHHRCMCRAVMEVQKQECAKGNGIELDNMYVWVDFCSVSQEHRGMQILAISSLTVYSAVSNAFVIVAPLAFHKNNGERCDLGTYNTRGWCRAETLSKVCASGFRNMYMMTSIDGSLIPYTIRDLKNNTCSIFVFEGVFSCCTMGHKDQTHCDKEHLAEPALGLYYLALERLQLRDPLLSYLRSNKNRLYPETFKFFIEPGDDPDNQQFEERELFGNLVELMEEYRLETV